MNLRHRKNIKVISFAVVLAVLLISSVVSYYYYETKGESIRYQYLLNNRHSNQIEYVDRKVTGLLDEVEATLSLMLNSTPMKNYFEDRSKVSRDSLNNLLSIVAINQKLYTQVQILDHLGMEQVRVKNANQVLKVVESNELKDKSHRDYVRFARTLDAGQVGYWGIDFDVDIQDIAQAKQTMMRAITPIHSGDAHHGYLVVNFDVHEFIESLDFSFFEGYHLGFVSPEGEYFGSVMQGEFTFAKEFIDGRSDSIPEQFPALWQQMLANERGYWVHQGQFYNYISTQYYPGLQQLGAYILMVSPSNELKKKLSDNAIFVLLCSVILVISTFIFFVRLINRYETDTMERKLIHATINGVAGLVVVDKLGNVTKTNHKFSRLFGYTEEQATGMSLQSLGLDNDENKLLSILSSARQNRYWVGELEGKNRFGAWLALSAKCEVFLDSVGDVDSYVITFTDVSKNKVLEGKLRKLGDTDPLTGCWNRRKFDQELDKQVNLANRYSDYESSLAIIDIDHFKTINDTLGHLEGDRILQRFAFLVRSACRDTDLVTRIGGEEFALIMPKTSPIQAMKALERVKQVLNEQHDLKVKFSGGVSEIKHSAQQCYHNADSMLYRAKHSGRDQILMWCESQNEALVVEGRES